MRALITAYLAHERELIGRQQVPGKRVIISERDDNGIGKEEGAYLVPSTVMMRVMVDGPLRISPFLASMPTMYFSG
jgi:hypothetical protein